MNINATLINLYNVCSRECWLHANGVRMEHTSDTVSDGKLLHEESYTGRSVKHSELSIEAIYKNINLYGKVDFFEAKNKTIHETKRGNKVEDAHIWQLKFYLWLFFLNGIENAQGLIEYPLLRETRQVVLQPEDIEKLKNLVLEIFKLLQADNCPPRIKKGICKSCSYYELCYVDE